MTDLDNDEGQVLILLFLDANGWPDDETVAHSAIVVPAQEGEVSTEIASVPAGPIAVSVIHDEDGDRELGFTFGIPDEEYGFSNDARGTFGSPSFAEARVDLAAGEMKQVTIKVK